MNLLEIQDSILWIMGIWMVSLFLIIFYQLYFFTALNKKRLNQIIKTDFVPVSVIIAARNGKDLLEKNLPSILNQNYPNFEVIVVNDCSYDKTKDWIEKLQKTETKLKLVNLEIDEKFQKGKKFALTMGIKAAANELLLFTDADCAPQSDSWIQKMVSAKGNKQMVLGFSPHQKKVRWWHFFIHFETYYTAIQFFSFSIRKMPYMGVGRNMMYEKSLFFKHKGFASHQHVLSGDDDLFVQEAATSKNTAVCLNPDSFVETMPPLSFKKWVHQKLRHHSTSKLYQFKFKFLLGLSALNHIVFTFIGIFLLLYFSLNSTFHFSDVSVIWWLSGFLIIKYIIQGIVLFPSAKHFQFRPAVWLAPVYDILFALYLIIFSGLNIFYKVHSWNG
jgi:cellulose synthase/poly-beta-1,6-N-acetylglucosamine synthase-like glycosyltransferase